MKKETEQNNPNPNVNGLLTEYNALRSEILKRIELRNSILFGTLTFAGVLLGFGLTTPTLALIYVIISTFLAAAWVQSDVMISDVGKYIRDNLESVHTGLSWETKRQKERLKSVTKKKFQPSIVFSTGGGVFIVTQVVALLIASSNIKSFALLEWLLGAVAVVGMFATVFFFYYANKQN